MPLPTSVSLTGDRAKTVALFKRMFPNHTPQQVAAAAGMVHSHLPVQMFHAGDSTLGVESNSGGTFLLRYFTQEKDLMGNPTGKLVLNHESQTVSPDLKGQGHKRFAEQLDHLDKLGGLVSKIRIGTAAGSAESNQWRKPQDHTTGYHAWPSYGFQGNLEDYHVDELSPEIQSQLGDKRDLHSLFAIKGAAADWKAKGRAVHDLSFDLAPDSEHRKRFKAYYDQREAKAAGSTGAVGTTAGAGTSASGTGQAGAGATEEGTRYTAGTTRLERIRQRLRAAKYAAGAATKYVHPKRVEQIAQAAKGIGVVDYNPTLTETVSPFDYPAIEAALTAEEKSHLQHLYDTTSAAWPDLLHQFHSENPHRFQRPIEESKWGPAGRYGHRLAFSTPAGTYTASVSPPKKGLHPQFTFEDAGDEVGITGAGHAVEVFSKVAPALVAYLHHFKPDTLQFTAAEKSRRRLYDSLTEALPHLNPEYTVSSEDQGQNKVYTLQKAKQAKYATERPVAHPSVAGFQLEHALRRAISDPETTSDLKGLAHALLTEGVNRSDAAYGIHDEVESLHPDHWLRKANYNWSAIPHKMHLDAAVGHAIDAVVRVRKQQMPDLHELHHRFGSTEAIAHFVENPEDFDTADRSAAHSAAQEAAEELLKVANSSDLMDSLERHQTRNQSLRNADPTFRGHKTSLEQEQTTALQPLEGWPDRYAAKGKNPEGGLTVAEARRQGVRAGSETAAEAKKAGGFSKIEGKTQKRRKSFCARACGQAKQFPKAAKDPESRLRKALRIWGCRCSASKNTAEEEAEKYAKAKPTYSPLVSHAAAVLDDPNLGAVGAFADHLADAYPDHPLTQAMHRWISGESFRDTLQPLLRDNPTHYVVGAAPKEIRDVDKRRMGVIAAERDPVPEGVRAFQKLEGNTHWVEVNPSRVNSSAPINRRKITSAEVAQHLFDKGGLSGLVQAVLGAQHFHPERVAEREQGARENAVTFYKAEPVKYQSPALSDFISAVRQIRSSNQEVRRQIAEQQYKKLGLSALVRDAIADAPHTASANTAQAVEHNGDLDKVRAAAALYAQQTESPQLLLFHEHADGSDLLHKFDAEGSAEKLRQLLDGAGFYNRTLSPTPTGWSAFFFDPKGEQHQKLLAFTQKAGYNLETSVGTGERVGDGQEAEANKENRSDYRQFIQQYEKQQGIR
jgi:hypothetical protein